MRKVMLLAVMLFLTMSSVYAHSGRLDGNGGHRVQKEWIYEGRAIILRDSRKELYEGKILFGEGDYHYHINPIHNLDITGGIFLPVKDKDIKNTVTNTIGITEETRVGSKNSDIYHKPDCRYIRKIKEENIVLFRDYIDAEKDAYIPCKRCKPAKEEK